MNRLLLLLLTLGAGAAYAQPPSVSARVEPDSIAIGDRFTYTIEVERDLVQVVEFPAFEAQDPASGIELVEELPVDTLLREGRRLKLRKRYRMAAFEEGLIDLGRAAVLYADKNILDTLYAPESLRLEVGTFAIDSTSPSIYELKPQKNLPLRAGELSGYIAWSLLGLLLIAGAVWAGLRIARRYGKRIGGMFRPTPPLPPHVAAIRALEALHNQKLWQNNRHKQYYSGLSDILRTYIASRWGIGAMEMTSDEIISAMRNVDLPQKSAMDLTGVLRDADLVKFAKATPEAEQNEGDYLKSYYFVEETKEQEEPAEGAESDILDSKFNGDA